MIKIRAVKAALLATPLALGMAAPVRAEDGAALAARFGARPAVESVSLAPGGGQLALIVPDSGTGDILQIVDLAKGGEPKTIMRATGKGERIRQCSWPSDVRLVCTVTITANVIDNIATISRLITLNPDGSDLKLLTKETSSRALGLAYGGGAVIDWFAGRPGEVLMTRNFVPESTMGTHLADTAEGYGVESVDVSSLHRSVVEPARDRAYAYLSDGHGTVRVMGISPEGSGGYDSNRSNWYYRTPGNRS